MEGQTDNLISPKQKEIQRVPPISPCTPRPCRACLQTEKSRHPTSPSVSTGSEVQLVTDAEEEGRKAGEEGGLGQFDL